MKKFFSIAMIALAVSTSMTASAVKPKAVVNERACYAEALQMYGDMLDCGMVQSRALRYAVNHYYYCVDASKKTNSIQPASNHISQGIN